MSGRVLPSAEIVALSREAGFDLCGFARAEPIPLEVLGEWIASGMAADMDWMAARVAERIDVRSLVPGARTVISLACNYYIWDAELEDSPVSRYARGRDYHATLKDRLRSLRRAFDGRWPGVRMYATVDTGPVMEKVWAVRAGLGYVGRNGCLITPRFGSWVFLATAVLEAEVDRYAEELVADGCGACSRCISACPTDAILPNRAVDARQCLSYQTIENSGRVPEELRPFFDNLVFGCDICQAVCPLNATPVPVPGGGRFAPRPLASLGVRQLAALTREEYSELVPGTPLARAGYDGLRRNAAYALGAMRDAGAEELLACLVQDPSEVVADAARWALERIHDAPAGSP
ncbi:MAG TPA: tRNA epoxyqueuosine(34) reductase QueG [Myxococcaceae bacterium]|nr:tRNA epoxyqueuosine(34) reductase QueG [Myxococcaceae bacterium]